MKIKDITPEIFIPYYDTSLFITPTWDGATVNRIVLNDIYAKKNVGVPVKVWNGSTWVDSTYKDAGKLNYIQWIIEFIELNDTPIPPIKRCRCYPGGGGIKICEFSVSGPTGLGNCGFSFFGGNCTGTCNDRISPVDPN